MIGQQSKLKETWVGSTKNPVSPKWSGILSKVGRGIRVHYIPMGSTYADLKWLWHQFGNNQW